MATKENEAHRLLALFVPEQLLTRLISVPLDFTSQEARSAHPRFNAWNVRHHDLPAMTSLRAFRPTDLLRLSLTNLDPLTENYDLAFYMKYLVVWPSLFTVAEDQYGNIIGYSTSCSFQSLTSSKIDSYQVFHSDGQSRRGS